MPKYFVFKDIVKSDEANKLNLSHWSLPQVGEKAKKVQTIEEVQESIKKLENEAYEKGYTAGFTKGESEGKTKAYEEAKGEIEHRLLSIDDLLACFNEPIIQFANLIESQLLDLIKILFKNFLEKEVEDKEAYIIKILNDSLGELPISNEKKYIYLNPEDKAFLDSVLAEYIDDWQNKYGQLVIDENPEFGRGEALIKTSETTVDATVETRIKNLLNFEED